MNIVQYLQSKAKQVRTTGIVMIVLGVIALISPLVAGISIALIIGLVILLVGLTMLILASGAGMTSSGIFLGLVGLISTFAGLYMLFNPKAGLAVLTIVLAIYFILQGVGEIITGLQLRPGQGWGWFLSLGVLSVLLGGIIWQQFPVSGVWAVGILVGIRLLSSGIVLVTLASSFRRVTSRTG